MQCLNQVSVCIGGDLSWALRAGITLRPPLSSGPSAGWLAAPKGAMEKVGCSLAVSLALQLAEEGSRPGFRMGWFAS